MELYQRNYSITITPMTQKTPIEVLDFMIENYSGINGVYHEVYDALEEAKERIQALPIESQWIPVSENIERNKTYLLYAKE
jgi:hypothetical protein